MYSVLYYEIFNILRNKWREVEDRLRSSIKEIVPCDIFHENPLDPLKPEPFDCIISSTTLESACTDLDSFNKAIRSLAGLLKKGGTLIMSGCCGCDMYIVGGQTFSCFNFKQPMLEAGVKAAGCEVVSYIERKVVGVDEGYLSGLYMLVSRKL